MQSNKGHLFSRKIPQLRAKPLLFIIRKYQSRDYSLFSVTYKNQDLISHTHHPPVVKIIVIIHRKFDFCHQIHSDSGKVLEEREGGTQILLLHHDAILCRCKHIILVDYLVVFFFPDVLREECRFSVT